MTFVNNWRVTSLRIWYIHAFDSLNYIYTNIRLLFVWVCYLWLLCVCFRFSILFSLSLPKNLIIIHSFLQSYRPLMSCQLTLNLSIEYMYSNSHYHIINAQCIHKVTTFVFYILTCEVYFDLVFLILFHSLLTKRPYII